MFSNVALVFVAIVQPEGAVTVDQMIAYSQCKNVNIFAMEWDDLAELCKCLCHKRRYMACWE
jgi:hypothetical protein